MAISDAIKAYRGGSASDPQGAPAPIEPPGPNPGGRSIPLTDSEAKEFQPYADAPAITAQVVGRLEGTDFHVLSVRYEGVGEDQGDADQVMSSPGSVPMQ